jgi:hypothetical protein
MDPKLDPNLGPNDEYVYECMYCFMNRSNAPNQEYASNSRDHDVIVAAAKRHCKQTGHKVYVCLKKCILEIY